MLISKKLLIQPWLVLPYCQLVTSLFYLGLNWYRHTAKHPSLIKSYINNNSENINTIKINSANKNILITSEKKPVIDNEYIFKEMWSKYKIGDIDQLL